MCKTILTAMILVLLSAVSADAFVEVRHDRLEVDGKILGKAINETEMDEMRGGYMGFSFSVLFEGWWNSLEGASSSLQSGTEAPGSISGANLPTNTALNVQATVGDMGAARGIFLITQVPGSNNLVNTTLNVNIQIIQVLGDSIANLPSMPWR